MGRPNADPILTRANVTFHTNDEDKDFDTRVDVSVSLSDETIAYISDPFGRFADYSDAGPFTLLMKNPVGVNEIRLATADLAIHPVFSVPGTGDTWRFNFLLDLFFSDGSHLLSRASNLELSTFFPQQTFGLE